MISDDKELMLGLDWSFCVGLEGELEDFRVGEEILDVGFRARSFVRLAGCGDYCLRSGKKAVGFRKMGFSWGSPGALRY